MANLLKVPALDPPFCVMFFYPLLALLEVAVAGNWALGALRHASPPPRVPYLHGSIFFVDLLIAVWAVGEA